MKEEAGVVITGERYMEIMWPLNDMFRARLHLFRHLPYDPAFEKQADEAILRLEHNPASAWENLPLEVWRVLLERHAQMLAVAAANMVAGNPLTTLPPGPPLSDSDLRVGLAFLWLLKMKLPFPAGDRSRYEFPPVPSAKGH